MSVLLKIGSRCDKLSSCDFPGQLVMLKRIAHPEAMSFLCDTYRQATNGLLGLDALFEKSAAKRNSAKSMQSFAWASSALRSVGNGLCRHSETKLLEIEKAVDLALPRCVYLFNDLLYFQAILRKRRKIQPLTRPAPRSLCTVNSDSSTGPPATRTTPTPRPTPRRPRPAPASNNSRPNSAKVSPPSTCSPRQ